MCANIIGDIRPTGQDFLPSCSILLTIQVYGSTSFQWEINLDMTSRQFRIDLQKKLGISKDFKIIKKNDGQEIASSQNSGNPMLLKELGNSGNMTLIIEIKDEYVPEGNYLEGASTMQFPDFTSSSILPARPLPDAPRFQRGMYLVGECQQCKKTIYVAARSIFRASFDTSFNIREARTQCRCETCQYNKLSPRDVKNLLFFDCSYTMQGTRASFSGTIPGEAIQQVVTFDKQAMKDWDYLDVTVREPLMTQESEQPPLISGPQVSKSPVQISETDTQSTVENLVFLAMLVGVVALGGFGICRFRK